MNSSQNELRSHQSGRRQEPDSNVLLTRAWNKVRVSGPRFDGQDPKEIRLNLLPDFQPCESDVSNKLGGMQMNSKIAPQRDYSAMLPKEREKKVKMDE